MEVAPAKPDEALAQALAAWHGVTGRVPFVLVGPFESPLPDRVDSEIQRFFSGSDIPDDLAVDVILESDGGVADAAFQSAIILRNHAKSLRVFVPRWAKSAATLFSLSADEIDLSITGQLGPLDVQVVDPRDPARWMSALDGYQSVEHVRTFATVTLDLFITMMLNRSRFQLSEIVALGSSFATRVARPILGQVRPLDFGGWGRNLSIGQRYAVSLLQRYPLRGHKPGEAEAIAESLVFGYPHHGYVIDVEEAKGLGLPCVQMDQSLVRVAGTVVHLAEAVGAGISGVGYVGFAPGVSWSDTRTREETQVADQTEQGDDTDASREESGQDVVTAAHVAAADGDEQRSPDGEGTGDVAPGGQLSSSTGDKKRAAKLA